VEILPSIVSVNELLEELSKSVNSKDITHKHNITLKSQTLHKVTLPRDNSKGLTHILFHAMSLSLYRTVHTMPLPIILFTLCLSLSYCSCYVPFYHTVHAMSLSIVLFILCLSLLYYSLLYTMYYFKAIRFTQSWDSSAGTVNRPWARTPRIIVLFLAGSRDCFLLHIIQSGSRDYPITC
jgi:hypothetical protein